MLSNEVKGEGYWGRRLRLQIQDKLFSDLMLIFRTLARMSMFAMETLPRGRRPGSVLGLTLSSKLGTWLYNSVRERIKSFKDSLNLKSSEVCDYAGHAGAWVQQVVLMTQSPLVWTQGPVLGLHSRDRGWCEDPQTQQCLRNYFIVSSPDWRVLDWRNSSPTL